MADLPGGTLPIAARKRPRREMEGEDVERLRAERLRLGAVSAEGRFVLGRSC